MTTKTLKLTSVKIKEGRLKGLILSPDKDPEMTEDGIIRAVYTAKDGPRTVMVYYGKSNHQAEQTVEQGLTELVEKFLNLIPASVTYSKEKGYSDSTSGKKLRFNTNVGRFVTS